MKHTRPLIAALLLSPLAALTASELKGSHEEKTVRARLRRHQINFFRLKST
jgi:hypothetical protein